MSLSKEQARHADKLAAVSDKIHNVVHASGVTVLEGIVSLSLVLREALKMRHCECEECKTLDTLLDNLIQGGLLATGNAKKQAIN